MWSSNTKGRRTRSPAVPGSSPTLAVAGRFVTKTFRYKSQTTARKKILEGFHENINNINSRYEDT